MDLLISGCINLKENYAFIESNIIISLFYFFSFFFSKFISLRWALVAARSIFSHGKQTGAFSCGMRDLAPQPGIKPGPLHWECGVSAPGSPGKFQSVLFLN